MAQITLKWPGGGPRAPKGSTAQGDGCPESPAPCCLPGLPRPAGQVPTTATDQVPFVSPACGRPRTAHRKLSKATWLPVAHSRNLGPTRTREGHTPPVPSLRPGRPRRAPSHPTFMWAITRLSLCTSDLCLLCPRGASSPGPYTRLTNARAPNPLLPLLIHSVVWLVFSEVLNKYSAQPSDPGPLPGLVAETDTNRWVMRLCF